MRKFAIINTHEDVDICKNLIEKLGTEDEIIVFQGVDKQFEHSDNVKFVKITEDALERTSKTKNYVTKYFFDINYKGFLHVIEDSIEILNETSTFLCELEKMMTKLELKSWLNTITDVCNYTFKVYNPRFSVDIDEPTAKSAYDKTIYWTSHANTAWICYDYSKSEFKDFEFDEKFKIPMYYIIKFLSERRNNKKDGELNYMNYYPTIKEELGMFRNIEISEKNEVKKEDLQEEGKIFEEMKINHDPDMSIEKVMDDLFAVLTKNN